MTLTTENKAKLNDLARLMRTRTVTKQEIMTKYGVHERVARDMISEIAKRAPIISTSDNKGYRIATAYQDLGDVRHAHNENSKRAGEILKRNIPLEEFMDTILQEAEG